MIACRIRASSSAALPRTCAQVLRTRAPVSVINRSCQRTRYLNRILVQPLGMTDLSQADCQACGTNPSALEREGPFSSAFLQDKFLCPPMVGVERS